MRWDDGRWDCEIIYEIRWDQMRWWEDDKMVDEMGDEICWDIKLTIISHLPSHLIYYLISSTISSDRNQSKFKNVIWRGGIMKWDGRLWDEMVDCEMRSWHGRWWDERMGRLKKRKNIRKRRNQKILYKLW